MKINERKIHLMIRENPNLMLKGLTVSATEFSLISAQDLLRREVIEGYRRGIVIGKIDLILRYKGTQYVTEIKYDEPGIVSSDFWNSLKVIGYTEYYKWQTGLNIKSAIVVPIHSIKLEQQIIASLLKLTVFVVYEEDGKFKLKLLNEKPIWQQKNGK